MLRGQHLATAVIMMFSAAGLAADRGPPEAIAALTPLRATVPGTGFEVITGISNVDRATGLVRPELIRAIENWLSSRLGIAPPANPALVAFVTSRQIFAMRHRDVPADRMTSAGLAETLALYGDEELTIYLPTEWTGNTPAELSVLVHEMVHHIQNVAGLKYECPEAREKEAFAAQEEWLALFGMDLQGEFDIDPFTMLVQTTCKY